MLDCAVCIIWGIGLHRTLGIQPKPSLPCGCSPVGFNADSVIDRVSKTLLTAKIPLGRLDGDVAQQKLDLVQVPSGIAAQPRAGPTEVVRGQIFNCGPFGAVLDDMPDRPLRYTPSPNLTSPANAPKHAAFAQACRNKPRVDGALDPIRNGHGSNVTSLAN